MGRTSTERGEERRGRDGEWGMDGECSGWKEVEGEMMEWNRQRKREKKRRREKRCVLKGYEGIGVRWGGMGRDGEGWGGLSE